MLCRKPKKQQSINSPARYQWIDLLENPFPTSSINKNSKDPRINGNIYEPGIRKNEYDTIESAYLKVSQTDTSRLRLGYICDTSHTGIGNGKSTFLVNLIDKINNQYCLDISDESNKCFAIYIAPETGGRTKTIDDFVDLIFQAIYSSGIIASSLASLRLDVVIAAKAVDFIDMYDEQELIDLLNTKEWFTDRRMDHQEITDIILENEFLQKLPYDFPLKLSGNTWNDPFTSVESFRIAYRELKKTREKLDFIFSHLVSLFMASGFNGAYIFVDNFERIPDSQSERQKKDFATELRSVLLDGPYENARFGFFNLFLAMHAGVPALISDAWSSSGLEQLYSFYPKMTSPHLIPFDGLNGEHVSILIKKYLATYRVPSFSGNALAPFTPDAITMIAEESDYNAATILRNCHTLIEKSLNEDRQVIDEDYVRNEMENLRRLGLSE